MGCKVSLKTITLKGTLANSLSGFHLCISVVTMFSVLFQAFKENILGLDLIWEISGCTILEGLF